jgi:hypothetical protein
MEESERFVRYASKELLRNWTAFFPCKTHVRSPVGKWSGEGLPIVVLIAEAQSSAYRGCQKFCPIRFT